jgi:hypothetical protein
MLGNAEYSRTYGAPTAQLRGEFFMDMVRETRASLDAGRDVFSEVERVKIIIPGLIASIVVHNVNDEHRQRWPEAYAAFKAGREAPLSGTPLEEWPILNRAAIAELKHMQIRTVEDLAGLSDIAVQAIGMGGMTLRERARAWLDDATHEALTNRLLHENDGLRSEVATLRHQVEELSRHLSTLTEHLAQSTDHRRGARSYVPGDDDPVEIAKARLPGLPGVSAVPSALDTLAGSLARRPASRRRREIETGTPPENLSEGAEDGAAEAAA